MAVSRSDLPTSVRGWTITQFYSKDYRGGAVFQAVYDNPSATASDFEMYMVTGSVEGGEQVFYAHRGAGRVGPFATLDEAVDCLRELTEAPEVP